MGDRVSISFVNSAAPEWGRESVALFSHWDGLTLPAAATAYVKELAREQAEKPSRVSGPLDRRQPNTVMVDFLRWLTNERTGMEPGKRITGNYYLGANADDGDNGDNGHFRIELAI